MYERRIDNARKAVAIAFLICGIGLAIAARQDDWHRYDARRHDLWSATAVIFGLSLLACLVFTAGLIVERLIRFWNGRPLTVLEVFLAGLLGLFACVAVPPAFCIFHVLCDNLGFRSLTRGLATCATVCLAIGVGLGVHRIARGRYGGPGALSRYGFAIAALFGFMACAAFAAFVALRSDEGHRQRDAVAALQQASCKTYFDYQIDHRGYTESKSLSWVPKWLAEMAGIDFFHRIVRVDVVNPTRDINGILANLQALVGLRHLHLQAGTPSKVVRRFESAVPSCRIKFVRDFDAEYIP